MKRTWLDLFICFISVNPRSGAGREVKGIVEQYHLGVAYFLKKPRCVYLADIKKALLMSKNSTTARLEREVRDRTGASVFQNDQDYVVLVHK